MRRTAKITSKITSQSVKRFEQRIFNFQIHYITQLHKDEQLPENKWRGWVKYIDSLTGIDFQFNKTKYQFDNLQFLICVL